MHIYFVRHGETVSNKDKKVQGSDDQLSDLGIEQVNKVAERLKDMDISSIFSSPWPRALDTANAISKKLKLPVKTSDLFVERKNAKKLIGMGHEDDIIVELNKIRDKKKIEDPHWKFEDEDGFLDLKKRALEALSFISKQEGKNILVVTHGIFLRYLLGCMLFGEDLDHKTLDVLKTKFHVHNTAISKCRFKPKEGDKPDRWHIINWNDVTHL